MTHGRVSLNAVACAAAVVVVFCPLTAALPAGPQDEAAQTSAEGTDTVAPETAGAPRSLSEGQVRVLDAVVMRVVGRAQWRPDAEAAWRNAQVNDVIAPGAMIRTGRNSMMALRVGRHATILVDRQTRLALPEIIQEGQTLRTAVGLRRGRADFKVDRVGLTNDFSVVTPTSIIAVRGTGYGVRYGGFRGTEISDIRTDAITAIEARYFLAGRTYRLTTASGSSDEHADPAVNGLYGTLGPPRLLDALIEEQVAPELLVDSFARNPLRDFRRVDLSLERLRDRFDLPLFQEVIEMIEDRIGDLIDDGQLGDGHGEYEGQGEVYP